MVRSEVSVILPTFCRGSVLIETLCRLGSIVDPDDEILVVDQTPAHPAEIETALAALRDQGAIRWLRLPHPSIPHAMNVGLQEARGDCVLFLDDDIRPDPALVAAHRRAHASASLVAGMVLQPGERPQTLRDGEPFRFNSDAPASIEEFMGGNFSVRRDLALQLGGFDENFVGAAFRFEAEFAHRFVARFGPIAYVPAAVIHHLAIPTGGTRAHGHHLRTARPAHSVGAYYYLLRTRRPGWLAQLLWRPLRAIRTRHHLRRPWWIPLTLLAELRGLAWAWSLWRKGPSLLPSGTVAIRG